MTQYNMDPTKGGIKFDGGKPQWHLLPLETLEGVVRVLMHGAKKYAPFNWANGMPYTRVLDATMRHINAIYQGEDKDPDSGLDHVDHALCELIFLKYYMLHGKGEDDRFKRGGEEKPPEHVWRVEDLRIDPDNHHARFFDPRTLSTEHIIRVTHDDDEAMEDPDDRDHWGV